jgi:radical SAM-linked protein
MTKTTRVRLRFAKCGDLRLVSHHDLMRCLERMLRRAAVPVAVSQGFNPRPKMIFALPLALGIEGTEEVVDLELSQPVDPPELLASLSAVAPAGFHWTEALSLPAGAQVPRPHTVSYCIPVPPERAGAARVALESLLASSSWPLTRKRPDRERTFDVRAHLVDAALAPDGLLSFRLNVSADGSLRPEELLEALSLRDLLDAGAVLTRTKVDLVS